VPKCVFVNSGAQSDSEVAETAAVADGSSDRGYTSDSELYDAPKRDNALSSSDTKLKPSGGSWLMVSLARVYRSTQISVCMYVCLSTKSFFDFSEIWHVGRGR